MRSISTVAKVDPSMSIFMGTGCCSMFEKVAAEFFLWSPLSDKSKTAVLYRHTFCSN